MVLKLRKLFRIPVTRLLLLMTLVLVLAVLAVPGLWVNMRIPVAPLALRGRPMALCMSRLVPCGLMSRWNMVLMARLKPQVGTSPSRVTVLPVAQRPP